MQYPKDETIKNMFLKIEKQYQRSDEWHIRITADELDCPISYVRSVLAELESKGEI